MRHEDVISCLVENGLALCLQHSFENNLPQRKELHFNLQKKTQINSVTMKVELLKVSKLYVVESLFFYSFTFKIKSINYIFRN